MRVIEQLVHHFWARGALTREEAQFLVAHGFAREADLPGLVGQEREIDPETYAPPPADFDEYEAEAKAALNQADDAKARQAEELEDELVGRNAGSRKGGGKKKKPTGHNLAPADALLAGHFAARAAYPALCEWGCKLRPCSDWHDAARAVAAARPEALETALVSLLAARPRALGELWLWFDLEPLYAWAEDAANAGPVADGLAKLLAADTPSRVGRLGQLAKSAEVQALLDLLPARRAFLNLLPVLYHAYFPKLGLWLVPPVGDAARCWPSLPWSFVLVYNARQGTAEKPPPGYPLDPDALPLPLLKQALTTAIAQAPVAVRELLVTGLSTNADRPAFARKLHCPYTWRV
jgi:hypothetical protein